MHTYRPSLQICSIQLKNNEDGSLAHQITIHRYTYVRLYVHRHSTNLYVTLRSISVGKIEFQWFIEGMVDLANEQHKNLISMLQKVY